MFKPKLNWCACQQKCWRGRGLSRSSIITFLEWLNFWRKFHWFPCPTDWWISSQLLAAPLYRLTTRLLRTQLYKQSQKPHCSNILSAVQFCGKVKPPRLSQSNHSELHKRLTQYKLPKVSKQQTSQKLFLLSQSSRANPAPTDSCCTQKPPTPRADNNLLK